MSIRRTLAPLTLLAVILTALATLPPPAVLAKGRSPPKPWLFFDLGDTLVKTVIDPASHDMVRISWMRYYDEDGTVSDAFAYLTKMKAKGYPIGLIANIPQNWADPDLSKAKAWLAESDPVRRQALASALTRQKLGAMNDFFEGHGQGDAADHARRWNDPAHPAMEWEIFGPAFLLVPFFDEYRKPDKGPAQRDDQLFLFHQAFRLASRANTRLIYHGDNKWEIEAARGVGLISRLVPFQPNAEVQPKGFYLDEGGIEGLLKR
jgi:hypothetical protein